jgi:hypothetical protein
MKTVMNRQQYSVVSEGKSLLIRDMVKVAVREGLVAAATCLAVLGSNPGFLVP